MSIDAIAQKIAQAPAPVLFFDTCIFLDILRAPYRDELPINQSSVVRTLIDMCDDTNRLVWPVTSDLVSYEIDDNIDLVSAEAERELKKMARQRQRYIQVVKDTTLADVDYGYDGSTQTLLNQLKMLMAELRNQCEILAFGDQHAGRAMERVKLATPPSSKGKSEAKDCLILEVFLDLAVKLKDLAFPSPIYLVTSNTSDFGYAGEPKIKIDLDQTGTNLVNNLEHAKYLVTNSTVP